MAVRAKALIATHQLRWVGHVRRMDKDIFLKIVLYSEQKRGMRNQGGQKLQFKDSVKRNMKKEGVPHDKWEETAADRDMACRGEPSWPLRKSASKNTRECTTEGALPRPVMSFVILSESGTAGPERNYRPTREPV